MAGRFIWPDYRALGNVGQVEPGAKLEFFISETSTQLDTFSDQALTIPNTNPVIADGAGQFGDIFLSEVDYRVTYSDADDEQFWDRDPVSNFTLITNQTFEAGDGSISLPSYTFTNANTTGFYRDQTDAGNSVGISTDGTFVGRFTDNQNLVMSSDTEIFSSNGIRAKLQINGSIGSDSALALARFSADTFSNQIHMVKSRSATVGAFSAALIGDTLGQVIFGADNGTTYSDIGARITSVLMETAGATVQSNLRFYTGGNSIKYEINTGGDFLPVEPAANQELGANVAANAFDNIYSQNALTIVSDASYKHEPQGLSLSEHRAFLKCALSMKTFQKISPWQYNEDGSERPLEDRLGDLLHVGIIAQDIVTIFEEFDLDAHDYKLLSKGADGKYMVGYDHIHNGALSALAHGVTL